MKKQNFIHGSLILIASAAIAKVIGAIFRIPLANMLGGVGMGYFSTAYGIFMTVYAVSVTGLPVAAAKLTAEASNDPALREKTRRTALIIYLLIGIIFTFLTIIPAYPFCKYISGSENSAFAVAAIAPSILFGCISALYRGYFEGLRNMYPTAVSQVTEGFVKLAAGLFCCNYILEADCSKLKYILNSVYSFIPISQNTDIESLRMPLAAAGAVFGVTLSTAAGTIYIVIRSFLSREKALPCQKSAKSIASQLFAIIIPVALGSLVTNLTSLIDLATITRSVSSAIEKSPEYFSRYISAEVSVSQLPDFFFGSFTGLAVTIFNLIPSFTNMFGKGAIPPIAEAFSKKDTFGINRSVTNLIFTASFIAVPAGIGISALAPQILELLFPSRAAEISLCIFPLRVLGVGIFFLSISSVLFSALQAVGKGIIPVKIMLIGVIIKLIGNTILVKIPMLNITGAALSTVICYGVIMVLSIYAVKKYAYISIKDVYSLLAKLFFCGLLCAAAAISAEMFLENFTLSRLTVFFSAFFGAVIYIISTHLMGILTKSTLKLLIC